MDPADVETSDLLAGLHDIRLPVEAAGGLFADTAAALGLGLLLALCLAPALRILTRQRPRRRVSSIDDRIAALARLDDTPRREGLLRLVAELKPETLRRMEPGIYAPGGLPTSEALESALRGTTP